MIAVVTHRVFGSVRTCSSLSQPNIARRGSSPKILGGLAPGPLHVITNTVSVIKTGKHSKIWVPSHKLGAWAPAPGPSVEPRLHMATE